MFLGQKGTVPFYEKSQMMEFEMKIRTKAVHTGVNIDKIFMIRNGSAKNLRGYLGGLAGSFQGRCDDEVYFFFSFFPCCFSLQP